MFGFFNVNKPVGPTSHDVVAAVRRRVGRKIKVGHAGTLDPLADGVLVLCVGPATRLADYVQAEPKRYLAEVTLGATSTTDDNEGRITASPAAAAPSAEVVRQAVRGFIGTIRQVPPAHSAVHVGGRRAYKLARAGRQVDLPAREVTINAIAILEYEYPRLRLDVVCGSGTYIRALGRDIGAELGVGGYCSKLTRAAVGKFELQSAVSVEDLDPQRDLLNPLLALEELEKITVGGADVPKIAMGQRIGVPGACGFQAAGREREVVLVNDKNELLAIGRLEEDEGGIQPITVFVAGG